MKLHSNVLAVAALIGGISLLGRSNAAAASIVVPNFSFEAPDAADGQNASPGPTGWLTVNAGGFDPIDSKYPGTTGDNANTLGVLPHGGQAGFVFANGTMGGSLTTAASLLTIANNTTYTLTAAVGQEALTGAGGRAGFSAGIELLAGGVTIPAGSRFGITVVPGTFQDFSVSFTTGANDPLAGQALTVRLSQAGAAANQFPAPSFDNVRLDATVVPEPTAVALLGACGLGLLARRRRVH